MGERDHTGEARRYRSAIVEFSDTTSGRPTDPTDLVGTVVAERFQLLRLLSEGANTAIFDASDTQTGRTVTVKLVRPRLAAAPSFKARFDETMRAVAALSHPNIAAIYDWGIGRIGNSSTAYVVIEHLSGGSVRDMFDRGRRLTPSQALAVGLDACRGLDHAHRRGFVHGELTPSKLVFGDDRRLRIVDFGLARLLGEQAWEVPAAVSTHVAWYASPEQGAGGAYNEKTDVYALCLALHEAVTGVIPFASDSTAQSLAARVGRLMPVSADLGPLAAVLERAGRPEAEDRSTAAEFGAALVQAAANLPRPSPLPVLATSLFDMPAEQLRPPVDTSGVLTQADEFVVVPIDEPGTITASVSEQPIDAVDLAPVVDARSSEPIDLPTESLPIVSTTQVPAIVLAPVVVESRLDTQQELVTRQIPISVERVPSRRRGPSVKLLAGFAVVVALAGLSVLAVQLLQPPSFFVPELSGIPEAEARNTIAANGWVVTVEEERSDTVPTIGQVVRTAPSAGDELAQGEPFLLVISAGPLLRTLPDSTGVLLSEAQTALVALALVPETLDGYDELVPIGTVISWSVPLDPTATVGSQVEPQTVVQLVVSVGPAPRIVPLLVGMPIGEALALLKVLSLVAVEGEPAFSPDIPLGSVVAQSVDPESEAPRDSEVVVVVSKGPDLVMYPAFVDVRTFEQAAIVLRASGFEPVLTFGDAQGAIRTILIDGVAPVAGEPYLRGTRVEITAL